MKTVSQLLLRKKYVFAFPTLVLLLNLVWILSYSGGWYLAK